MEALIKDVLTFLLQYYALYLVIFMSIVTAIIMVILNYTKKPFKKLTAKIENARVRKFVNNSVIICCSFILSFLLWLLLNLIAPNYFAMDYKIIFLNGAIPVVTYAFAEGWITADKAKEIIKDTTEKVNDGDLTVAEATNTVKKLNNSLDAEKELNKLLKK